MELYLYVSLEGDKPWQSAVEPTDKQKKQVEQGRLQIFQLDGEGNDARFVLMDLDGEWDDVEYTQ